MILAALTQEVRVMKLTLENGHLTGKFTLWLYQGR
jgi:hypothetical protein